MNEYTTSFPLVESNTIARPAAADIQDVRGKAMVLGEDGRAALAAGGSAPIVGIALLSAGAANLPQGNGGVKVGDDIDIQVGAMGYGLAGAEIKPGQPLTSDGGGALVPATAGSYVVATALGPARQGGMVFCQITKYVM